MFGIREKGNLAYIIGTEEYKRDATNTSILITQ